jgi:hypothetical protein
MPSVGVWRHSGLLPLHRQRCLQRLGLSFLGRSFEFQLLRGKILKTQSYSLASFDVTLLHRSVVVPQDDLGTPASPSRTRSPDPKVVGEALADDARTATPPRGAAESRAASPPVADTGVASPPHTVQAGEGTSVGDVGVATSPRIIDVNPINARPAGADELIKDQPQFGQALRGPGTFGTQVPESSSSSPRLLQRELTGMAPLGRMISSRTTRICRPCGPALLPSIMR